MNIADQPSPKRKRLSYACNYCRQKKTRCDEQQPSCRTCRIAGVQCITTDKRRAGVVVSHRRRSQATTTVEPQTLNTPDSHTEPSPVPSSRSRPGVPTQCWDRAGWQSGRLPMMPRFVGGSMFEIMTEWLDLAFFRLRIPAPYASLPSAGVAPSPGIVLQAAPALPSADEMRLFGDRFLDTIQHIYPFIAEDQLRHICSLKYSVSASDQALIYLVATFGLMTGPVSHQSKPTISYYLIHINSLLGHLVAERSLASVQATLLMAIVFRCCDHVAQAWDVLSLGVSMAQSIGINQSHFGHSDQSHTQAYNTWWCMYVFEKILAFESGRASMIWDRDLSSFRPLHDLERLPMSNDQRWTLACVSLANTLHEMQDRASGAWRREEWIPQTVDEAVEEKILTGGELVTLLEDWWKSLPGEFPSVSALDSGIRQQSAFLSFYYRYAVISLNRSVLLIEAREIQEVVARYASDKPWRHIIANGANICVEAAREMVKLIVALLDSGIPTYLTTLTSPLTAVYTLAIHILRERHSLLIRSDLEVMKAAIAVTSQHYQRLDSDQRIEDILSALEMYAGECIQGQVPQPFTRHGSGEDSHSLAFPVGGDSVIGHSIWSPSVLDWTGWDWNDLSHLFANSE
ncbi:hypothetical protein BJX70DRAFT_403319 [Aspergillus crustosus]